MSARWRTLIAAALSAAALSAAASTAYAGNDQYCPGWQGYYLTGGDCAGPDHTLRQNRAYAASGQQHVVGSYATYPGTTTWYGSPVYAINYVCHSYTGTSILTPWNVNDRSYYTMGERLSILDHPPCDIPTSPRGKTRSMVRHPGLLEGVSFDTHTFSVGPDLTLTTF